MNEDTFNVLHAMLSSFWYNRATESIISLIREVLLRVQNLDNGSEWTDDGNILFGTLVLMFGNYGVSPRAGWIDLEYKQDLVNELQEELNEYKGILEREEH